MATRKTRYHRLDIAARQLDTAVWMFLEGKDRFSVITLAGAADGILMRLVLNANKQPFVDYGRLIVNELFGYTPSREKYRRYLNLQFGIDALRHHSPTDPPTLELDEEVAAENALAKAVLNYIELCGQEAGFVRAFLQWMWITRDGPKIMKDFQALPERIKRLKRK